MSKTEQEKKEYQRLKQQESRERKKSLGISLNNPDVVRNAVKKYRKNPDKGTWVLYGEVSDIQKIKELLNEVKGKNYLEKILNQISND